MAQAKKFWIEAESSSHKRCKVLRNKNRTRCGSTSQAFVAVIEDCGTITEHNKRANNLFGNFSSIDYLPENSLTESPLQDKKLDIEHAGWKRKIKTLRKSNEILIQKRAEQNPKHLKRGFSKTVNRRPLKLGTQPQVAKRNLLFYFWGHITQTTPLRPSHVGELKVI